MANRKRDLHVLFPLGGLNREGSYRQQPPYTSTDLSNVRSSATIEGRERGGSRPGLIESHIDDIGSNPRLLSPMILALGDNFTSFSDTFAGTSLEAAWTQASWASDVPSILSEALASVDTSVSEGEVVRDTLPIDVANPYTVEMFITPWEGAFHGEYRLYMRLDDTVPAIATDGVQVILTMTGTDGSYSCTMTSYLVGADTEYTTVTGTLTSARPGWLSATVDGDDITVYWNGVSLMTETVDAQAGVGVGFGLSCSVDGGLCLVNVFRVQYYATSTLSGSRTMLIASAGGDLNREETYGRLTAVASDLTVRDDVLLTAAQSGQKLYIADYGDLKATGTDGNVAGAVLASATYEPWPASIASPNYDDVVVITNVGGATVAGTYKILSRAVNDLTLTEAPGNGTCSFRIERAPKIYDPSANTIAIYTATEGQTPTGCPLICRYLDCIVLAGADIAPHVWYMARQGTETDWDYSQVDNRRAVAGSSSEAGVPGQAILALVPHSDDYLIMGCRTELWRLRGHPAYGGMLDALSRTIGIIGPNAWCLGPGGELIFLSLDGLYILPPGGDSAPIPMSREVLPREFKNLDPSTMTILLEFDTNDRGVHIFLTPESSNARIHWWFDWEGKTYWPMSLASDHEPMAICALQSTAIEDSSVVLGCRDGKLRRFSDLAETDCGTSYTSYAKVGPIPLARDGSYGKVLSMVSVMAADSGDVTWSVHAETTFEGAANASVSDTGTWGGGLNATDYPSCRGQACMLKIAGTAGSKWAMEQVIMTTAMSGRLRLP